MSQEIVKLDRREKFRLGDDFVDVPAGTRVAVIQVQHGMYHLEAADGSQGRVWASFVSRTGLTTADLHGEPK